jgi:NAD+ kinase
MAVMARKQKVIIIRNPGKVAVEATVSSLAADINGLAEVTATGTLAETADLLQTEPDRVMVLGGDGSILAVARVMNGRPIPVAGVNFGKLGYLAEYSIEDVGRHLDAILYDSTLISQRMMLQAIVARPDGETICSTAVNDCVIHAGPPYRMVILSILVDGEQITTVVGDGMVLSTPTGSTAHNMSAGGPIVHSEVSGIVLTPLSPHSLTHRPLVVASSSTITIIARQVNDGTMVAVDGQLLVPLRTGDQLVVERHTRDFLLIRNPSRTAWHTLTSKLKWGQ